MAPKGIGSYFHRGALQNSTQYHTYCKACVYRHLDSIGVTPADLLEGSQAFKAVRAAKSSPGLPISLAARSHAQTCPQKPKHSRQLLQKEIKDAKLKEKEEPKKHQHMGSSAQDVPAPPLKKQHTQSMLSGMMFHRNKMPFKTDEKATFQVQALHAVVSSRAPFQIFEDPEMKILFGMLRTMALDFVPSGKVIGGQLLNQAAEKVEEKLKKKLNMDAWKSQKRDAINALCTNADFKSYLLELIDITALKKDGPSQVNDTASLIAEDATTLIVWINNHGKLFILCQTLMLAVLQSRTAIIAAEVSAAESTEAKWLRDNAKRMCELIKDVTFWSGLETLLGDLKPICLGTNINQKDSTHVDQVVLTITGIFLHFADHLEAGAGKDGQQDEDLLEDQQDRNSSERGCILISSAVGWRTEVAKWIGDACVAKRAETVVDGKDQEDDEITVPIPNRLPVWKPMTLQALADAAEDDVPVNGAIEIESDEEYHE
ncbi:hypothetical protein B0H10DRAFT_1957451 [Mycena sp. CBHHK59/15]|nr:hypothetical protein B0H10DRAFT_1957451 [Mycena sp. CBHHK59/15]